MRFYTGTHKGHWLGLYPVPWFVSRRTLAPRKALPRALTGWALDSGGFTELEKYGAWTVEPEDYVSEVRRFAEEVGRLEWAAPQDWMCEPGMLQRTGLTVAEHQRRTVENFLTLRSLAADLPFVPVLQGWTCDDYHRHVEQYAAAGVDLEREPLVGLGSVCRRQHLQSIAGLIRSLHPLQLHGFGFKLTGLGLAARDLASSDSMAWSIDARRGERLPECSHRRCANCPRYALLWREKALERIERGRLGQLQFVF